MLQKIFHIKAGETEMYEIDARHALKTFPAEWSEKPWPEGSKAPATTEPTGVDFTAPFEAKSKGSGWWAVFDANGKEIGKSMREDDAKAFNEMSDDDKAEYVKALTFES